MDELSKDTDLSRVRPTRRASTPGNPLKALGRGRAFRLLRRRRQRQDREVLVNRSTDLTELEGVPGPRADSGAPFEVSIEGRHWWTHIKIMLVAPVHSPQGIALTTAGLLITGAFLGGCSCAVGYMWGVAILPTAIVAGLLFLSPIVTYFLLRPRR